MRARLVALFSLLAGGGSPALASSNAPGKSLRYEGRPHFDFGRLYGPPKNARHKPHQRAARRKRRRR